MALFNDGPISTIDDLTTYDSSLLNVASNEGIDVTRKLSLAQDEVSIALTTLLPQGMNAGLDNVVAITSLGLQNVVVTTPLRLWHTFRSLALVYEDAYYSQLNDRYQGKWKAYAERARWAQEKLTQAGVGFVSDPIPQAQPPILTAVAGSQTSAAYFVTMTWLNSSGGEGSPSEYRSLSTDSGNTIQVTPVAPPPNAVGWNIYAGYSADSMGLQNQTSLASNQPWTFTGATLASGQLPGTGQPPDFLRALPRILQRG